MKAGLKTLLKNRKLLLLTLMTMCVLEFGCNTSKPVPNPLANFHSSSLNNLHSNKAITDDYHLYIQKLSLKSGDFVGNVDFLENGAGQHAVDIKIGVSGTWWEHVLIYNKDNKRVQEIKYRNGGYRS
jgi:hypothetical protein